MESDVDLAAHHALALARARGKVLASVTLRSGAPVDVVDALVRAALRRLGLSTVEVRVVRAAQHGDGRVELASVELSPALAHGA
jgi:hypothetical protein